MTIDETEQHYAPLNCPSRTTRKRTASIATVVTMPGDGDNARFSARLDDNA
jgi:hypothetical protein